MAVGVDGDEQPDAPRVEVQAGGVPGMAQIVGNLLGQAIYKQPRRAARIRGSLALRGTDRDAGVTTRFEGERVLVTGAADPDASVVIEGPLMTLAKLASGGHVVRAVLRREVRVRRALRHPLLLMRVRRLLKDL